MGAREAGHRVQAGRAVRLRAASVIHGRLHRQRGLPAVLLAAGWAARVLGACFLDGALGRGVRRSCFCDGGWAALDAVEADSGGRGDDEEGVWEGVGGVSAPYETFRAWFVLRGYVLGLA